MTRAACRLPHCDCRGFCEVAPSGARGGTGNISAHLAKMWDGQPCTYCGRAMDSSFLEAAPTRDHVQPRSREGVNRPENITIVCWTCNQYKHYRTLAEWLVVLIADDDDRAPRVAEFMLKHGLETP